MRIERLQFEKADLLAQIKVMLEDPYSRNLPYLTVRGLWSILPTHPTPRMQLTPSKSLPDRTSIIGSMKKAARS